MQIIKNSSIYLGASIIKNAAPFFLLPVITRYLTPTDFGILSIFLVLNSLLGAFVGMNIHSNISKNYFSVSKNELSIIIGNIFFILIVNTLIVTLLTYGVSNYWEIVFSIPSKMLLILPTLSFFMMINTINLTILRNEGKAYTFGVFETIHTVVNIGVTLLFLTVYSFGWLSQVIGLVVSNSLFLFISLFYMIKRNYITLRISKEKVYSILNLSLPFIPHVLGGIVIGMSDRIFIEQMISLEVVALYAIGYRFGNIVALFTDSFMKAWSPWFYKNITDTSNRTKIKIVRFTYKYIFSIFILAGILSVIAKVIMPYMVTESFYGAEEYIFWIAFGYAIQGIYKIFFPYLVHINRTKFLALSTVLAAIINIVLNYYLIIEFGAIGAAYSTVISFLVSAIMVFWYQNRKHPMPWVLGVGFKKRKQVE